MKKIFVLLALVTVAHIAGAKQLNVAIFFNQYLNTKSEPYIETYFSLDPHSVKLAKNENNAWQGGIEILLTIEKNNEIVAYDKLLLHSTETLDTNSNLPVTVQQSRLRLDTGKYIMKVELVDINKTDGVITMEQPIFIRMKMDEVETSGILILDSYQESSAESVVSKWGYDLVPIVPIGTYYLGDYVTNLPFYCEIFNTDVAFGKDNPYLIKYYLRDNLNDKILERYAGFQKGTGTTVSPVLNTFNIKNLPSGHYDLVIDVINKENQVVQSEKVAFYRMNLEADYKDYDFAEVQLTNTFVESMNNSDSMYYYVDCLYPISTDGERRIAANLLKGNETNQMQKFFLAFWNKRNPLDPKTSWLLYMDKVEYANKQFRSNATPGYRTDMGRVLLQYGAPSSIERSTQDPSNYPHQIWQYDMLESASTALQNNVMFVFVDQTLAGRNYTLTHSTAIGEVKDHKWKYSLNRTTNRGGNVDATSTQYGRDAFGYRVDNNFIIGDHRYWGDRQ